MISDMKDIKFTIFKQLKLKEMIKKDAEWNAEWGPTANMVLAETRNFAVNELVPSNIIGDRTGVRFHGDSFVEVPECYHKMWKVMSEEGYIAMTEDPDFGGMNMPHLLAMGCSELMTGGNFAFMMYPGLTRAMGNLLLEYGDHVQKDYVHDLFNGNIAGTMLLTEPDAGSDLGAVKTEAAHQNDSEYVLNGEKIFISNGEHNLTDNILHPVLARIEDAPPGTKGLSLFLVPKVLMNGVKNGIKCTGIEHKMGIHGNGTCTMTLNNATGYIIGKPGEGMRIMFSLMNEARIMVASQGLATGAVGYEYALKYAKERIQGRHYSNFADQSADSVPIIQHPDVKRNLIHMKSLTEGMRGLLYYAANLIDRAKVTDCEMYRGKLEGMLDLLTPLLKGYITERGYECADLAMQVYGGVGYTQEFPIEQLVRDGRITRIYEGTTGIQALTLIARNLFLKKGAVLFDLLIEIEKTLAEYKTADKLPRFHTEFKFALDKLSHLITLVGQKLQSGHLETVLTYATKIMMCIGDVMVAWQLLWKCGIDPAKYNVQARYFILHELQNTVGVIGTITENINEADIIPESVFK